MNGVIDDRQSKTPAARDDLVSVAIGLGWDIAELYRDVKRDKSGQSAREPSSNQGRDDDDLPGLSKLPPQRRRQLRRHQIEFAITALSARAEAAGRTLPKTPCHFDHAESDKRIQAVREFHELLLIELTAADFRLGKAYGLGRALVDTCVVDSSTQLREQLNVYRLGNLKSWLLDLKTALPEHAGEAVHQSLERWEEWCADLEPPDDHGAEQEAERQTFARVSQVLKRQGKAWRAVLTGEKNPTDALERRDYVLAGRAMLDDALALTRDVPLTLRLGIPALVLVAFVGVFVAAFTESGAAVVAALGGLAGVLGISWASIAKTAGSTLAKLRAPLWDAALDGAVAEAITCLDALPDEVRS